MENEHNMNAERQSLKDKLMAIILLETSKNYKEMDSDLVTECVDFLMELEGKERLTKAETEQRVNEIPFKGKVTAIGSYAKKKIRAKRLAVIAAILAFIIALFGIIAIATGDTFKEFFVRMGNSFYEMIENGSLSDEDITYIKPNETKTYSSIEELIKNEELGILYPTWLPENEKIIKVWYLIEGESERYLLQCNNPNHSIEIEVGSDLPEEIKSSCSQIEINTYSILLKEKEEFTQANFVYNNSWYSVKSDAKDNLFKIIENLEEIN